RRTTPPAAKRPRRATSTCRASSPRAGRQSPSAKSAKSQPSSIARATAAFTAPHFPKRFPSRPVRTCTASQPRTTPPVARLLSSQYESMVKRMIHGFGARSGVFAAGLAAAGYSGIKQVLERPFGGLFHTFMYGSEPHFEPLTEGFGEVWQLEHIAFKNHALT